MLSRVAESIYWMARYVERAENTARLINVNLNLVLDLPRHARPGWVVLAEITGGEELFRTLYTRDDQRSVLRFLLADARNPGSLLSSLAHARENARTIRDFIPRESWEQLNSLHALAREQLGNASQRNRGVEDLRSLIVGAQTFTGTISGAMTRDAGYSFLRLGRNLERADMTSRIVDVRSADFTEGPDLPGTPYSNLLWMSVLRSLTAYQMYRREMQVRVQRTDVLKYLLQDTRFPRAFRYCVAQVESELAELPRNAGALGIARRLAREIEDCEVGGLQQAELHALIDKLQLGLAELHDAIASNYFRLERRRQDPAPAA